VYVYFKFHNPGGTFLTYMQPVKDLNLKSSSSYYKPDINKTKES